MANPRTGAASRARRLDRPSRIRMLWRRQQRLIRRLLLALPLLGLAAVAILAARGAIERAGTGSWFRREIGLALPVRHIDVIGTRLTTKAEVERALAIPVGSPIMRFSPLDAETRVEALPFIETATVSRLLPGTVRVAITERTPYAVWQDGGRFVLIDHTGKVVADQGLNGKDAEAFARLPLVVGHGAAAGAGALIDTLATAPAVKAATVAMVRVGDRRWNLDLRNGCQVLLPEAEEAPAIARLATLETQYRLFERPLATIDMRLPDRLVLRPDPTPPPSKDDTGGASSAADPGGAAIDGKARAAPDGEHKAT